MLLFFLKFMTQNCGSYVTVQLLQTLNILFENIRHQTSLCELVLLKFVGRVKPVLMTPVCNDHFKINPSDLVVV